MVFKVGETVVYPHHGAALIEEIKVRKICQLALSFDHRVVDGQQGSQFLADVGALLADPGIAMTY